MSEKMQPGTECAARFVGEFERDTFDTRMQIPNPGDVALVYVTTERYGRTPYAFIKCGLCGSTDYIPLQQRPNDQHPIWNLTSREPVNLEPSVRVMHHDGRVCHYFVHGGRFQALADSVVAPPTA